MDRKFVNFTGLVVAVFMVFAAAILFSADIRADVYSNATYVDSATWWWTDTDDVAEYTNRASIELEITPSEDYEASDFSFYLYKSGKKIASGEGTDAWIFVSDTTLAPENDFFPEGTYTIVFYCNNTKVYQDSCTVYNDYEMPNGWYEVDGLTYYFVDGVVQNGFQTIDGNTYYFDDFGVMQTGFVTVDGEDYYFDNLGVMQTGFVVIKGETYYFGDETGWVKDNGNWYYLDSSSNIVTGWVKDGTSWYFLASNGVMQTGWILDGASWYYLRSSGSMATGWIKDGGVWYYLNRDGSMATGWVKDGSNWYYLKPSGAMTTGWQNVNGIWYYLNSNGSMATGWIDCGGSWYYLNNNGSMAFNTWIDNYYVDASGVWVA